MRAITAMLFGFSGAVLIQKNGTRANRIGPRSFPVGLDKVRTIRDHETRIVFGASGEIDPDGFKVYREDFGIFDYQSQGE